MKFTITMKDPDGFYESVMDAITEDVRGIQDPDEREAVRQVREEKTHALLKRWFEYAEYLTVEVDTVAETCTVVTRETA